MSASIANAELARKVEQCKAALDAADVALHKFREANLSRGMLRPGVSLETFRRGDAELGQMVREKVSELQQALRIFAADVRRRNTEAGNILRQQHHEHLGGGELMARGAKR